MKHTGSDWSFASASGGIVNTTPVAVKAATANFRTFITSVQLKNTHATVATELSIVDSGTTTLWLGRLPAAMLNGDHFTFEVPLIAAGAVTVVCGTTGAAVYVNAQGYIAP